MKDFNDIMTTEQDKEQTRRNALMVLWKERHPSEEMTMLDVQLMECLILLGKEYDLNYKNKKEEERLFKMSVKLREWLGIKIVEKNQNGKKSPMNENKSIDNKK